MRERRGCGWEDNGNTADKETKWEGVDWMHLAQDTGKWRAGVRWIFRKWDVGAWTGSSWLRIGTVGGHLCLR